jgi:hypothetical protein
VHNGVNGLTFQHRNAQSLADAMSQALDSPIQFAKLGERGYLHSPDGNVPCNDQHTDRMIGLYRRLLHGAASNVQSVVTSAAAPPPIKKLAAPWRITLDTNPDDCQFQFVRPLPSSLLLCSHLWGGGGVQLHDVRATLRIFATSGCTQSARRTTPAHAL